MVAPPIAAPQSAAEGLAVLPAAAGHNLYVANFKGSTVTVYASGSDKLLRTISHSVNVPVALAFDGSGNLYVANNPYYQKGTIAIYAPGANKALRRISRGVNHPVGTAPSLPTATLSLQAKKLVTKIGGPVE
jgi:DNA-binding beta-propeller fold protein YncE